MIQEVQNTLLVHRWCKIDYHKKGRRTELSLVHKTGPFLIWLLGNHLIELIKNLLHSR